MKSSLKNALVAGLLWLLSPVFEVAALVLAEFGAPVWLSRFCSRGS
jgi:hypothetical protein